MKKTMFVVQGVVCVAAWEEEAEALEVEVMVKECVAQVCTALACIIMACISAGAGRFAR